MRARPDMDQGVDSGTEHEQRFRRLYAANVEAMFAYAVRRVEQPADAADVIAETFLVAWRRRGAMPGDDEVRLWLYGVARRVLANHHRGGARRERLGERLRQRLRTTTAIDPGSEVPERLTVRAALARLGEADREILMLTFWEGLEPREAAVVLRISPPAARTRLARARARLREVLGHDVEPPGHVPHVMLARPTEEGR